MAEAVAAFITAAVAYVKTAIVAAGATIGLSAQASLTIASTLGKVALAYGAAALTARSLPRADAMAQSRKDPLADRVSAYGRNRLGLIYQLWEDKDGGEAFDVGAFHEGQVEAIETFWFHDDIVTINGSNEVVTESNGDQRYGVSRTDKRANIFYRLGLPVETSYTDDFSFSPLGAGVWTDDHRGDGIASLFCYYQGVEERYTRDTWPNGAPLPSVTARCLMVWDWRDGGQEEDDPFTWTASFNPIVQLADFLTDAAAVYTSPPAYVGQFGATYTRRGHGMGFDWSRIEAAIDDWTLAAEDCDDAISLKAGGTEPRYECHLAFTHSTAPSDVISAMLETCDGWLTTRGDGAFVPKAGVYRAPTVTFTDDHVIDYDVQRFVEDEQRIDGFVVSFTSPDHQFQEVETDAWGDLDSDRLQPLKLLSVQSHSQARRLAKRRLSQLGAGTRGSIVTNLYGLRGLGERFIALEVTEINSLNGIVIEVTSVAIDLMAMQLTYSFVVADPAVDAWNPATEEGDGPSLEAYVASDPLTAPTIDLIEPFFAPSSTGVAGVRLSIEATGPDRSDLSWYFRWRVDGSVSWTEGASTDLDLGSSVTLETGFVPADSTLEVEVAYSVGNGSLSPWSATAEASTDTTSDPPDAAASITLESWTASIFVTTPPIARATSYVWSIYEDDGTTLLNTIGTSVPQLAYTNTQALLDGIQRDYVIKVAGANLSGAGGTASTGVISNPAPGSVTGISDTGGTTAVIEFDEDSDSDLAGYILFYSDTSGFDPLTDGLVVRVGTSPFTLYGLATDTFYYRLAAYDLWTSYPTLLNLSAEGDFTITGSSTPPSGGGGGGGGGGGWGGGGDLVF